MPSKVARVKQAAMLLNQDISNRRNFPLLAVFTLFMAALFVRVLFGTYGIEVDRPFTGDEGGFHWEAVKLLGGEWGQRAHRAPFTALVITPAYWFLGAAPESGRWTMVVISSFGAPLLFSLARKVSGSLLVGVLAGLIWAVYPPSIFYSTLIYTETVSAVLVIASVLSYLSAAASGRRLMAFLTGVIWGCLALNRATFLLLPFGLLLFAMIFGVYLSSETRFKVSQWVVALAAFIGVLAPWTMHTYDLYGTFMPHNTRGGWTLLISNGNLDHPMVKEGGYSRDPKYYFPDFIPKPDNLTLDNMRREMAFRLIKDHLQNRPVDYFKVVLKRARNYWSSRPDSYDQSWTRNDWIMLFFWSPIVLTAIISPALRRWREFWPLTIIVVYSFFIALPFWGTPRFRYPVDPLIVAMASWGLVYLGRRVLYHLRTR